MLKRDIFFTVERGRFRTPERDVEAVLRRIDEVPWCLRHFLTRESPPYADRIVTDRARVASLPTRANRRSSPMMEERRNRRDRFTF